MAILLILSVEAHTSLCKESFRTEQPGSALNRLKSAVHAPFMSSKKRNNMEGVIEQLTPGEIKLLSIRDLELLHKIGLLNKFSFEQFLHFTDEQISQKSVLLSLQFIYNRERRLGPIHNERGELEFRFKVELLPQHIQHYFKVL